ncbi:MAG: FMN-binding protein [Actinobacteria bacterium]|nr:MAG: FMN-binding protein [Actinomycetota bacterium]
MRRTLTMLLTMVVLALPVADAVAAVKATKKKVIVVTKKFTGTAFEAGRWGSLQVTIKVRKTTTITGTKRKVTRKITAVGVPTYPNHTDRSVFINSQALPILKSETLRAQSASIDMVSGATDSSDAFAESLQSAILKARHA